MITGVAPGSVGIVVRTSGHGGGMPALDRVIRERGDPGRYHHAATGRRGDLAAVQITLAGSGTVWPGGEGRGPGLAVPRGRCLGFAFGQPLAYAAAGSEPWDFVYVNLAGAAALAMVGELTARRGHVLPVDPAHPAVARLCDLARGPGVRLRALDAATSARIACDLLCALAEADQAEADPERDLVEAACAQLAQGLAAPLPIAAVARECGVSREHLTRVFRRRLGVPPAAWLRRERLRRAELLLRAGGLAMSEIALRVGFAGASHFVQAFRQAYGLTPGRWRG